jgi:hypothetical protein
MNETLHQTANPEQNPQRQPIFVLGISPRCGTNFLSNLLLLHPDCVPPKNVWEDFAVAHADLLKRYSDRVARNWDPKWGVTEQTQQEFNHSLGTGISSFLELHSRGNRVVAKTPRVDNLGLFFHFFPDACLLILVRDGRAVVESGLRSFGWNQEATLHSLSKSARIIDDFRHSHDEKTYRYRIVKYEDLWQSPEEKLRELLVFLGLEVDVYDFDQASRLPIRGSSDLVYRQGENLHWDPVDLTPEFDPLSRYENWGPMKHYRYNRVAGKHMEALGYPRIDSPGPAWLWWIRSRMLDATWLLKAALRPLHQLLKRRSIAR